MRALIVSCVPAPSTSVVLSLSMVTRLAVPSIPRDVLELDAEILADHLAAGEDRDVLEHRLAAIAEAGALTAATLRPPRSLLTTSVANASPSMSSAMISSGRPDCTTASRIGSIA